MISLSRIAFRTKRVATPKIAQGRSYCEKSWTVLKCIGREVRYFLGDFPRFVCQLIFPKDKPIDWDALSPEEQAVYMAKIRAECNKLHSEDWLDR